MTIRKGGKGKSGGKPGRRKGPNTKSLPPMDSQRITLAEAVALTQRYRKAAPASEHAGFFWGDGLRDLLAQPGCVGVRYYHGLDEYGAYHMVLVGVDGDGNDITGPATSAGSRKRSLAAAAGEAVLLDRHFPCPPYCPDGSPLN